MQTVQIPRTTNESKNSILLWVFILVASCVYLSSYHTASNAFGYHIIATHDDAPRKPVEGRVAAESVTTNSTTEERQNEPTAVDATNITAADECIPFIDSKSNYDPTKEFLYRKSSKLPKWMKDYFDWHNTETQKINSCNYGDYKYMVLRCSKEEHKCGGLADRIKSLPFFIACAATSKRIFMIRWERPAKLEEFLLPNEVDWSFPDWMYNTDGFKTSRELQRRGKYIYRDSTKGTNVLFYEGLLQDFLGGSGPYYRLDSELDEHKTFNKTYAETAKDWAGWADYEVMFRDLWHTLFEPSPPIAKRVKDRMALGGLVSGEFATTHYRAFYAVEDKKEKRSEDTLISKAENALNCASMTMPGHAIYFASDSQMAVDFARNMSLTYPDRKIVTFDSDEEALHIDKAEQWTSGKISDFYPTFVDLLIMAEGRCMTLGVGGFGRFANILSPDPKCYISHDGRKNKTCKKWTEKK